MQNDNGFILIDRKIVDWEWFTDSITFHVWIYCLVKANWKKGRFQGVEVPRGSFVSSYPKMAKNAHISVRQARTAIFHLKTTGELTVKSYPKFSLITVNNYNRYQDVDRQRDSQATVNRQSIDSQSTTIEQSNKVTKKQIKDIKNKYGVYGHVLLTDKEYEKLNADFENADALIRYLDTYIEEKGYKSKNHNLTIRRWVVDAVNNGNKKSYNKDHVVIPKPAYMNDQYSNEPASNDQLQEALELQAKIKAKQN